MNYDILQKLLDKLNDTEISYDKNLSKIYKIHKYWARKPWYVVRKYIQKYSKENDIVLDPFCGSGVTGLEAICINRNFVGGDLNPMSILITNETTNTKFDLAAINADQIKLFELCKEKILNLYKLPERCLFCGNHIVVKYSKSGPKFTKKYIRTYCPHCHSKKSEFEITDERSPFKNKGDLWSPKIEFPKKFYKDRFSYKGINCVSDMYSDRNWYALSILFDAINKSVSKDNLNLFKLAFTNTLLHVSKLKGINVRPLGVNNYWVPDDYIEENVWFRFEERLENVIKSKQTLAERIHWTKTGKALASIHSATDPYDPESFDYVFTDPPYGDVIQYSELSYIWNAWIDAKYCNEQEIVINPAQGKKEEDFNQLLNTSLANIYHSLKIGGYFTLCFQNKDFKIWQNIIEQCKKLKFKLIDVDVYDLYGSTFNTNWAKFSPKSDIYVTFRKTDEEIEPCGQFKDLNITDIIESILEFLSNNNETFNLAKIYNLTVSYLIWLLYCNDDKLDYDFSVKTILEIIGSRFSQFN